MTSTTSSSLSPFAARIYGTAAVLAPLVLLASTLAYITAGDGINDGVLGGTIGVWSCFTLAIALVGVLRLLEPAAPKAAALLTAFTLIAFSGGVAFNITAIYLATFGNDFLEAGLQGGDAIGVLAFLPWGLLTPLTFVLVGIMLWRTRTVDWWSGALLVAGGILFVASRPARIDPLAVTADIVLALALIPIGWTMLTRTRSTSPATVN